MMLPQAVLELMKALEDRGFEAWAVGGCVRDDQLGLVPHDYDLCTGASPEQMRQVFAGRRLVLAGEKHGTVGVVTDGGVVEITAYRAEGDYTDSRHPGWVKFVSTVEQDLSRRDFTVNAMAYSPSRGYADPFGGLADLKKGILRAVGDPVRRFREDALRILRGLRFAARFGLTIEENTWNAMISEVAGLDRLSRERVFEELCRLLPLVGADFLLRAAPVITRAVAELEPTVGFCQHTPHHAYDVYTHTAHVVEGVPADPVLRFAALLHDVGKPRCFTLDETGRGHFLGHAETGAEMADQILRDLKAPGAFREEVVWLVGHHMSVYPPEKKYVRRALSRHGKERMERLLELELADAGGKGVEGSDRIGSLLKFRALLEEVSREEGRLTLRTLAVNGRDLMAVGFAAGPDLGRTLERLLSLVVAGQLPNEKQALLHAAEEFEKAVR